MICIGNKCGTSDGNPRWHQSQQLAAALKEIRMQLGARAAIGMVIRHRCHPRGPAQYPKAVEKWHGGHVLPVWVETESTEQ